MKYKKYFKSLFWLVILGFTVASCNSSGTTVTSEGTGTSAKSDFSDRILDKETFTAQIKKKGAVVIDVRMPQEFEQGAIEKAINIDFFAPTFKTDLLDLNRSKKYYLYCKNETRSYRAMTFMDKNDFKNVYILKGGFEKWNSTAAD
jgi:rhodanese-related sulfurtransferase